MVKDTEFDAQMNDGRALNDRGALGEAIVVFRRAAECAPHRPEPQVELARMLKRQNKYEEALSATQRELALLAEKVEAQQLLSELLSFREELKSAIRAVAV